MPLKGADVRIVIPAFRAEGTIHDCVCAVSRASANVEHEIVVVDDGGNTDLQARLAGLRIVLLRTSTGGSAARARNLGASGFTGRFLVFIDADVIVAPDCISRLIAPLREGCAEATVGNYTLDTTGLGFGASYKQIYVARIYARRVGYIQNDFWTAIGAANASVFNAVGGFDGSFVGANGEDAQFGRCLSANGHRILAVPDALGQHRHPLALGKVIANDWRKGVVAMRACSGRGEIRLPDNRHATSRDMLAVMLALASTAPLALAVLSLSATPLLAVPPLVALYMFARGDLAGHFASRGIRFLVYAVLLMAALDLLRAACAAHFIARHVADRWSGRHILEAARRDTNALELVDINTAQKS